MNNTTPIYLLWPEQLAFEDISLCFGIADMLFNQSRGFKHCDSEIDIAFLCGQNSCGCLDNIPGWGIRRKIYESREPGDYVRVKEVYGSQSISLNQDSYHIKISQQSPGVTKSLSSCAWSIYNSTSFIQHHQFKFSELAKSQNLFLFFLSWRGHWIAYNTWIGSYDIKSWIMCAMRHTIGNIKFVSG